jgi:copper chaperone CopZ
MKKNLLSLVALTLAFCSASAWACGNDGEHADHKSSSMQPASFTLVQSAHADSAANAVFQVKGMMCSSCKKKIEASLRKVDGVQAVSFDMKKKLAKVTFASGKTVAPEALIQAVKDAGFEAAPAKIN